MRGELAGPPMASTRMVSARAWSSAKGLHPVRRQPAFRELRQVHFAPPVYLHRANFHSFGGENLFTIGVGGGVKSDLCDHSSAFSGAAPLDRLLRRRPGAWSVVTSTPSLLAWKMRARSTCPWSNGVLHPHRLLNQIGHRKNVSRLATPCLHLHRPKRHSLFGRVQKQAPLYLSSLSHTPVIPAILAYPPPCTFQRRIAWRSGASLAH